jgi:hypothetical protein
MWCPAQKAGMRAVTAEMAKTTLAPVKAKNFMIFPLAS